MRYPLVDGQGNFGSVDGDTAGRDALHGGAPDRDRRRDARRHRQGHRRLRGQLRRHAEAADGPAGQAPEPARSTARRASPSAWRPTSRPTTSARSSTRRSRSSTTRTSPTDELCQLVTGPDFPTGGTIFRFETRRNPLTGEQETIDAIREMYAHGRGRVVMRAQVRVRGDARRPHRDHRHRAAVPGEQGRRCSRRSPISSRTRRSTASPTCATSPIATGCGSYIEIKRDANPHKVLNNLFKHTAMQTAFNMNMLALVDGQPQTLPLKSVLQHYIDHRREIVRRRTEFDLEQGARPGPHPRGPQDRARQPRRGDRDDPRDRPTSTPRGRT